MLRNKPNPRRLTPALLALWLTGCACELPSYSPPVEPAQIPPLPAQAHQPTPQTPCSPSCSAALTKEREAWLATLTPVAPQDSPAKPVTKP